jgi:hypothetical protein
MKNRRDFLGTVLPADLDDDDEMDVVIMDFSLDDFRVYRFR